MTNPDIEYERLVSGDAAAIKSFAGELDAVRHVLNGIREDLAGAGELPLWSGDAAQAFASRLVESGAEEFDHPLVIGTGWLWAVDDYWDLWANPYMTQTPMSDLGVSQPLEVEPGTLLSTADELAGPADGLKGAAAAAVRGVNVSAHHFVRCPKRRD